MNNQNNIFHFPHFKPIFVWSSDSKKPEHMQVPTLSKKVPLSFCENVQVKLMPWYVGLKHNEKYYIQKWCWKIVINTDDEFYKMESIFDLKEEAKNVYKHLTHCPQEEILKVLGFKRIRNDKI